MPEFCWFIYYRVEPQDLPRAVAAVRRAQGRLCHEQPGLRAAVMQRLPAAGGPVTMLETYSAAASWAAGLAAGLPARIEDVVGAAALPWVQGERHLEAFEPCA